MPFVATPVEIPEEIHPILLKISKSRTLPARQVQRARIILLAADGLNSFCTILVKMHDHIMSCIP